MPGVSGSLLRFEVNGEINYLQIASGIYKSVRTVSTSIKLTSAKLYFPKERGIPGYCFRWRPTVRDV